MRSRFAMRARSERRIRLTVRSEGRWRSKLAAYTEGRWGLHDSVKEKKVLFIDQLTDLCLAELEPKWQWSLKASGFARRMKLLNTPACQTITQQI